MAFPCDLPDKLGNTDILRAIYAKLDTISNQIYKVEIVTSGLPTSKDVKGVSKSIDSFKVSLNKTIKSLKPKPHQIQKMYYGPYYYDNFKSD